MREYVVSDETLRDLPYEINLKGREVVRCEECAGFATVPDKRLPAWWCMFLDKYTRPGHFCSWGFRRHE